MVGLIDMMLLRALKKKQLEGFPFEFTLRMFMSLTSITLAFIRKTIQGIPGSENFGNISLTVSCLLLVSLLQQRFRLLLQEVIRSIMRVRIEVLLSQRQELPTHYYHHHKIHLDHPRNLFAHSRKSCQTNTNRIRRWPSL